MPWFPQWSLASSILNGQKETGSHDKVNLAQLLISCRRKNIRKKVDHESDINMGNNKKTNGKTFKSCQAVATESFLRNYLKPLAFFGKIYWNWIGIIKIKSFLCLPFLTMINGRSFPTKREKCRRKVIFQLSKLTTKFAGLA